MNKICVVICFLIIFLQGCKYRKKIDSIIKPVNSLIHRNNTPELYKVKKGDSFWSIAKKYRLDPVNLMHSNGMKEPSELKVGMTLDLKIKPISEKNNLKTKTKNNSQNRINIKKNIKVKSSNIIKTKEVSNIKWNWPMKGKIIEKFGSDIASSGIIISSNSSKPVKSAAKGVVVYTGMEKGYTNVIIISHDEEYYTVYANNSKIVVKNNQKLKANELIGYSGYSKKFRSYILNFELRKKGVPIDPVKMIKTKLNE